MSYYTNMARQRFGLQERALEPVGGGRQVQQSRMR